MKGMAMVELLRQLERRAGAPIWTLFDVIGGTSTGGLLAVALGILRLNLDECQDIYTKLGNKVGLNCRCEYTLLQVLFSIAIVRCESLQYGWLTA